MQKKSPLSGPFHLGAIATLGPYYLPYLIGPLRKAYPQLELIISEGQTYELLNKLDKGELDAIIASRTFDESKYRIYTLFKEPFWLASPHDSSLYHNTKVKPIRTKDIDKDKIILLADGNCLKDEVVDFCQLSRTQTYKLQASSLETLKHLLS